MTEKFCVTGYKHKGAIKTKLHEKCFATEKEADEYHWQLQLLEENPMRLYEEPWAQPITENENPNNFLKTVFDIDIVQIWKKTYKADGTIKKVTKIDEFDWRYKPPPKK